MGSLTSWLLFGAVLLLGVLLARFAPHRWRPYRGTFAARGETAEAPDEGEAANTDLLACGCVRTSAAQWFCIYCMSARCDEHRNDPHPCNELARAEEHFDAAALMAEIYAYLGGHR